MKEFLQKIVYALRRAYRITIDFRSPEDVFWKDLKRYHSDANYNSGIFEKEKTIETIFGISKDLSAKYYFQVDDGFFYCRVNVLQDFQGELTPDLFILASHFNNLLNNGVVKVNTESRYVEYQVKRDLLVPLLFTAEIHTQTIGHYGISKDVYVAFKRLIEEEESPAIIIADLLRSKENEKKTAE